MKKSNILLIALFSLTLLVLLGSNLALKAEFDKIDRKNPLYGFRTETAKPFKFVKLEGKAFGLTEVRQGDKFEILASSEKKYYDWKVVGDTLIFNYKREWGLNGSFTEQTLTIAPTFYITAPDIKSITAQNVPFRVKNWKSGDLSINMENGVLLFSENTIANLNTNVQSGGLVKFEGNNNFGDVAVQVRDSSNLKVDKNIFKSFKADVDAAAHIQLPGALYQNVGEK